MSKKKKLTQSYKTLSLAEKHIVEEKTMTSRPSDANVEAAREWCIENKK